MKAYEETWTLEGGPTTWQCGTGDLSVSIYGDEEHAKLHNAGVIG